MTDTYAYDHGLPCKNPSCKSHGRPHPNCRCYGLAEGGEVEPFCSKDQAHQPDCEYFAGGGEVDPNDVIPDQPAEIDPSDVIPDQPAEIDPKDVIPDVGNDANADLPPDELQAKMVAAAHPGGPSQYESLPQQALTVGEGIAQGVAGPLATAAEKGLGKLGVPGFSDEDIVGRQNANPWEHHVAEGAGIAGSMALGTGEAALASTLGEGVAEVANLGKWGSAALKGAIENGLITGGDEVSKWMLGQGDPQDAAGSSLVHMGIAGLLGGALGAAGGKLGEVGEDRAASLADKKLGGKIRSVAAGFGAAAKTPDEAERAALDNTIAARYANGAGPEGGSFDLYKKGQGVFDMLLGNGINKTAGQVGGAVGAVIGGTHVGPVGKEVGRLIGNRVASKLAPVLGPYAGRLSKQYIAPITFQILKSENASGILDALNHAESMASGFNMVSKAVKGVMTGATNFGVNAYGDTKARKKLDDYINSGGVDQDIKDSLTDQNSSEPQPAAQGGEVEAQPQHAQAPLFNQGVANHFPEQNMLLSAAKGRVSGYLNSIRPLDNQERLPFDEPPDQTKQRKSYERALDIANQPLGILHEIGQGTLVPEHVQHLKAMYPEVDQLLQKKLTEGVMQAQVDGKKPPRHIRQGLSLYMGAALSQEMQPQSIQAAQAVFAPKGQPQPPPSGGGKSGSKAALTKSDQSFLTGNQALASRAQSRTS